MAGKEKAQPVILRVTRQVGKTTAVEMFSSGFDQYLSFNLEKNEDRAIFENEYPLGICFLPCFNKEL
jgi:predicted AAA+ superfamily ATPase